MLIRRPRLALFDDPLAGLDPLTAEHISAVIMARCAASGAAVVVAGGDRDQLRLFSGVRYQIADGRLRRLSGEREASS